MSSIVSEEIVSEENERYKFLNKAVLNGCSKEHDCDDINEEQSLTHPGFYSDGCRYETGIKCLDRLLDQQVAVGRIYRKEYKQTLKLWKYYQLLYLFDQNKNTESATIRPLIQPFVYKELQNKHLIDPSTTIEEISTTFSTDPGQLHLALFVSSTKQPVCLQACLGPCVSYYKLSLCEAFLFFCADENERKHKKYSLWINDLIHLYQTIAFSTHGDSTLKWLTGGDTLLRTARDRMATPISKSKNNVPEYKIIAFARMLRRCRVLNLLDFLPESIQEKMFNLITLDLTASSIGSSSSNANVKSTTSSSNSSSSDANVKSTTSSSNSSSSDATISSTPFASNSTLQAILNRTNLLQSTGDTLCECGKWPGRKLYRTHYITAMLAFHARDFFLKEGKPVDLSADVLEQFLNVDMVDLILDEILGERSPEPDDDNKGSSTSSSSNSSEKKKEPTRMFRDRIDAARVCDMAKDQIKSFLEGSTRATTSKENKGKKKRKGGKKGGGKKKKKK